MSKYLTKFYFKLEVEADYAEKLVSKEAQINPNPTSSISSPSFTLSNVLKLVLPSGHRVGGYVADSIIHLI